MCVFGDQDCHFHWEQPQAPEPARVCVYDRVLALRGVRVRYVDWAGEISISIFFKYILCSNLIVQI